MYHFNVYDGVDRLDRRGQELPDVPAARKEGSRIAGALLQNNHQSFWTGNDWHMEVTDPRGLVLLRIDVITSNSAATKGR